MQVEGDLPRVVGRRVGVPHFCADRRVGEVHRPHRKRSGRETRPAPALDLAGQVDFEFGLCREWPSRVALIPKRIDHAGMLRPFERVKRLLHARHVLAMLKPAPGHDGRAGIVAGQIAGK